MGSDGACQDDDVIVVWQEVQRTKTLKNKTNITKLHEKRGDRKNTQADSQENFNELKIFSRRFFELLLSFELRLLSNRE